MANTGALRGVRVVECTVGMAGPWIGRFMAYCGAEVIKLESHARPDVTRLYVPPRRPELGVQSQLSPWLTDWNAGKRCVALDLTRPEAVELAKRLVARSDVVVENYSAGVMEKLGLGYEALRAVKPDIVMFSSCGFGDSGPCRRYVTWGPNIEAVSGLAALSGFPHREAAITQYAHPDAASALHGLFAVLCALDYRRRTGLGQYVNLSQYETTVSGAGHAIMERLNGGPNPDRMGNRSLEAAPHGCYRCRGDDRWCAIAVAENRWRDFCALTGHPEWTEEARFATLQSRLLHVDALDRRVEEWTSQRDAYAVMNLLQENGIAAGVVQNVENLMRDDRQLAARRFFEEVEHAKLGRVTTTGIPLGLTGTPGRTGRAGVSVGEDNDYVFGEILAMSADEIRAAIACGAIETPRT